MENIRYPESDAEAIDAALAEHEDRKAALQIQRDILNQSKAGIFDGAEKEAKAKVQQNGKGSSSSDSSSDDDEDETVQVGWIRPDQLNQSYLLNFRLLRSTNCRLLIYRALLRRWTVQSLIVNMTHPV